MQVFQFGKSEIHYAEFFGIFKIYKEDTFIDPRELNEEQIDSLLLPYLYPAYFPFEEFKRFMEFFKWKEVDVSVDIDVTDTSKVSSVSRDEAESQDDPNNARKEIERTVDLVRLLSAIENAETDGMGFKDLGYVKIKEYPNGYSIMFEVPGGWLHHVFLTQKEMLDFILSKWW